MRLLGIMLPGKLLSCQGIDNRRGNRRKVCVRPVQSSLHQGNCGVSLFTWTSGLLGALIACKEEEPVLDNRAANRPSELVAMEGGNGSGEEGSGIQAVFLRNSNTDP